ncbi:unnamed protein product [marine sediment metagenome]|uniref:Uncharacterized protein n=1 Tax=marine sediment metagenome TaxID=412755 RepID=X1NPI4_9ZZZZ
MSNTAAYCEACDFAVLACIRKLKTGSVTRRMYAWSWLNWASHTEDVDFVLVDQYGPRFSCGLPVIENHDVVASIGYTFG